MRMSTRNNAPEKVASITYVNRSSVRPDPPLARQTLEAGYQGVGRIKRVV